MPAGVLDLAATASGSAVCMWGCRCTPDASQSCCLRGGAMQNHVAQAAHPTPAGSWVCTAWPHINASLSESFLVMHSALTPEPAAAGATAAGCVGRPLRHGMVLVNAPGHLRTHSCTTGWAHDAEATLSHANVRAAQAETCCPFPVFVCSVIATPLAVRSAIPSTVSSTTTAASSPTSPQSYTPTSAILTKHATWDGHIDGGKRVPAVCWLTSRQLSQLNAEPTWNSLQSPQLATLGV